MRRRVVLRVGAVAVTVAVATGTAWTLWPRETPRVDLIGTLELHGRTMHDGHGWCAGSNGYADLTDHASVTVYDASGALVAVGQLDPGTDQGWRPTDSRERSNQCWFDFRVSVPATGVYQVEVSDRGRVTVSAAEVQRGHVVLSVG